jgi:hypothetical protein
MHDAPHTFHIPVMGTGFTIDTPLKVARYGITSVVSLVDDILIEQMRKYHCGNLGEPYHEIKAQDKDSRARRITAYLNLLDKTVHKQMQKLRRSAFNPDSDISKYFQMLPSCSAKIAYEKMLEEKDQHKRATLQEQLRAMVRLGSIEVNIMTKLDRDRYRDGAVLPAKFSDALSALRGFANSALNTAVVFSAGINRRLYRYMAEFNDFFPNQTGEIKKNIVLKVSDYRSAFIQGKFLAKLGLWVSEYRVESGINCGGHAFVTGGRLLGPALDEFKTKRKELTDSLQAIYFKALKEKGKPIPQAPMKVRLTVQGGIGTAAEDDFFLKHYEFDGTGWGTPFLLVPEAVNLDKAHIDMLAKAGEEDVVLGNASPLGIPFWNLRNSASEMARKNQIKQNEPGSKCTKQFVAINTKFTNIPICPASKNYLARELKSLGASNLPAEQLLAARQKALQRVCLCQDLAASSTVDNHIDPGANTAVCCGPNIVNFNKTASLQEMISHIYGKLSLLSDNHRPHMFIREIHLYLEKLYADLNNPADPQLKGQQAPLDTVRSNLLEGIDYYRNLASQIIEKPKGRFLKDLNKLQAEIEKLTDFQQPEQPLAYAGGAIKS